MPVVVDDGDQAAAAGDALAGVVGPVLHHLLGRDVERHAHDVARLPRCERVASSGAWKRSRELVVVDAARSRRR